MHSKLRANIIFNFQAWMMKSGKKTAADSSAIEGIKASSETIKAITENSDAAQKAFKDLQKRQIELEMHRAEVIRLREDFQKFRENRGKRLPLSNHLIAVFASIGAGLSYSVWNTSVEADVYSTSILVLVIGLWIILHWDENREIRGDDNYILLLVYLVFLTLGIHMIPLLLIPGTLVFLLMTDRKIFQNPKLILFSIGLIAVSYTHLTLPTKRIV